MGKVIELSIAKLSTALLYISITINRIEIKQTYICVNILLK